MIEFKSRAVLSLVELHEQEMHDFQEVWKRFAVSGVPLPRTDDPSYESNEHLLAHVLRASRNYLTWIGEVLGRTFAEVDAESDALKIAARAAQFAQSVEASWRRHLSTLDDRDLEPVMHKSRWGEDYHVEQMLEHAVVHPMRHRIQLERLMRG